MHKKSLFKIGDLAKLSEVSVKTIRPHANTELLLPTARTKVRFRLFSKSGRVRLELIRTLSTADFGTGEVKKLDLSQK